MLMDTSVRDIHNDMIKPFYNSGLVSVFDSMTHKVLMSDTTLSSFIPPQDRKMTPKLSQICRCDICVTAKYMKIDLNRLRKILVADIQKNYVERNTRNSLFITTSDAN